MTTHHPQLVDTERTRCEVWTRVMGYYRPISAWNPGKRQEHKDRVYYHMPSGEPLRSRTPL